MKTELTVIYHFWYLKSIDFPLPSSFLVVKIPWNHQWLVKSSWNPYPKRSQTISGFSSGRLCDHHRGIPTSTLRGRQHGLRSAHARGHDQHPPRDGGGCGGWPGGTTVGNIWRKWWETSGKMERIMGEHVEIMWKLCKITRNYMESWEKHAENNDENGEIKEEHDRYMIYIYICYRYRYDRER